MLQTEVFPETIDLMHTLAQDRDNADFLIRESAPIDKVVFVMEVIAFDAEFGRDGARGNLMVHDTREGIEQAGDVAIRSACCSPQRSRV